VEDNADSRLAISRNHIFRVNYEEYREDGEVSSRKEFERLWKDYYPDKTVWYKFQTAEFEGILYFYLNGKLLFSIKADEPPIENNNDPDGFFDKVTPPIFLFMFQKLIINGKSCWQARALSGWKKPLE
jgi:hypothetical protein